MSMEFTLMIPAAGQGRRLGKDTSKAFVDLEGMPMICRTLQAFDSCDLIHERIVAVRDSDIQHAQDILPGCTVVAGGDKRQDSVLSTLSRASCEYVVIHDAARPFVSALLINEVLARAVETGAAIAALPVTDTIKRAEQGIIRETIPRASLWAAQTPQAFRTELLREALEIVNERDVDVTDDAQVLELLHHPVHIVEGNEGNMKITTPSDLARARHILREISSTG